MRSLWALAAVFCVLAGASARKPASPAAEAEALARAGQADAAERVLRKALAAGDESAGVHGQLGLLLYRAGKFSDAVVELGQAAQLDPAAPEYSMKLAASILAEKRFSVALEFLQAVRGRFEGLAEYQYNTGLAHYGLRDYPKAVAAFQEAIRIAPKMALAHFFLGNAYAVSGEPEKSLPCYRKALDLDPQNPGYYLTLGKVLAGIGPENDSEAMRLFRKALELRPGDVPSEYALASACMRAQDFACARPLLERAVARYPDEVAPHVQLARAYAGLKELDKAAAERETVKRLQQSQRQAADAKQP